MTATSCSIWARWRTKLAWTGADKMRTCWVRALTTKWEFGTSVSSHLLIVSRSSTRTRSSLTDRMRISLQLRMTRSWECGIRGSSIKSCIRLTCRRATSRALTLITYSPSSFWSQHPVISKCISFSPRQQYNNAMWAKNRYLLRVLLPLALASQFWKRDKAVWSFINCFLRIKREDSLSRMFLCLSLKISNLVSKSLRSGRILILLVKAILVILSHLIRS